MFDDILSAVRQIPKGKVSTYGSIARALNIRDVRKVGYALHTNKDPQVTPCHRVVKKDGSLAPGYVFGGEVAQMERLEKEGVVFKEGKVDLEKCLYEF